MILKFDRSLIFFYLIYIINQWIIKSNSSTVLSDHNGLCILHQRILAYHPIFCHYGVALVVFDLILGPVYTVSQVPLCKVSFRGERPNFMGEYVWSKEHTSQLICQPMECIGKPLLYYVQHHKMILPKESHAKYGSC